MSHISNSVMSVIDKLTKTQHDVLLHLASGLTVAEAALRLNRSVKSVDSHKYRIMRLLGVRDRLDLARVAICEGLIDASTIFVSADPPSVLSDRQREVLTLVARGLRVRQIAEELDISERSADSHKSKAMHRLKIHDRIGVFYYALQQGLIDAVSDSDP
jgi:DNA-binding NarL/FixJ family response regulator